MAQTEEADTFVSFNSLDFYSIDIPQPFSNLKKIKIGNKILKWRYSVI